MTNLQLLPLQVIDIGPSNRRYFFLQVERREVLEMFLCTSEGKTFEIAQDTIHINQHSHWSTMFFFVPVKSGHFCKV